VGDWLDFGGLGLPEGRFGQVHAVLPTSEYQHEWDYEPTVGAVEVRFPGRGIVCLTNGFAAVPVERPDDSLPVPFEPEPWADPVPDYDR